MKNPFYPYIFAILILSFFNITSAQENNIRPVQDNVGFCWYASEMDTLMDYLSKNSENAAQENGLLIGGISPHDDYLYAGRVYYPLYKLIKAKEVVIFGVTHGTVRKAMKAKSRITTLYPRMVCQMACSCFSAGASGLVSGMKR